MGENEKKLKDSPLLSEALQKCRELHLAVSDGAPNDQSKRDARLIGLTELKRWEANPAGEEATIAQLYPDEDPKAYFFTLKYVLRHFDTLYESVKQGWIKNEISSTTGDVKQQIHTTLN